MGVQFNLLPDVKLEFDQQQRTKRFVYIISSVACVVVLAILLVSILVVDVLQKKLLSDAQNDINTYSHNLKGITDLDKVLTIQNQLAALPKLHQSKHITSRFFTYLPQITPVNVFVGQVNLDLVANTVVINGTSDALESVNAFVDTMKFTNYTVNVNGQKTTKPAFTNVILTSSGRSDKGASYSITSSFDAALFNSAQAVTLDVPSDKITTRSVTNSPDINSLLFNGDTGKPTDTKATQ